jgi:hypothetical protein
MPLFNSQHQTSRSIHWSGTVATVVVQILVLLALSAAVAGYLEWSSDANQAEFISATTPSASDPTRLPRASNPVHAVKGRAGCDPKAQGTGP